ncbi:MAG: hypothetical protein J7598_01355 [Mitsuaria chitosanitabida]|uniref:hypothetical protein n=1 Tax=Roseateles chitosanitabidus TaxID=65048 RepID=UPI001B135105|nr:hypothetical protein [Roseateles chitosanitabidus]MBO9685233.1 hypothetical protein [Roseateles chitosanitabidus]
MIRWTPLVLLALAVLFYGLGFVAESQAIGVAGLVFEAAFWSRLFKRRAVDKRR